MVCIHIVGSVVCAGFVFDVLIVVVVANCIELPV